ncbi:ribosomal protein L5 domain-containing protein [Butyriboletus roseoflavus]|nr:ribosomal protein L5 domain-containing protein [Butyriboletus roseoflavus]
MQEEATKLQVENHKISKALEQASKEVQVQVERVKLFQGYIEQYKHKCNLEKKKRKAIENANHHPLPRKEDDSLMVVDANAPDMLHQDGPDFGWLDEACKVKGDQLTIPGDEDSELEKESEDEIQLSYPNTKGKQMVHGNSSRTALDPLIHETGFLLPSIHAAPPFFTEQPTPSTQSLFADHWTRLILSYARHRRLFTLRVEDAEAPGNDWDEILRNERINRRVLPSYLSSLLAILASKNLAVYEPAKQSRSVLLFWRQPEEWAEALHAWATASGQLNTILTFYEITDPPIPSPLSGLPVPLLRRAINILTRSGRAQIIGAEQKTTPTNPMKELRIEKLVINICVGESGDRLTRASKVLEQLTGQTPVTSKARYTVRTFGIRRNEKIAVHVTIRGPKAEEILERGLKVKEYELRRKNFSDTGNFGFGIQEHIDLGARYDPGIGIFGMDFYVVMGRPGMRVARRKERKARVGFQHRVTKDDTMSWFKQRFDGIILK